MLSVDPEPDERVSRDGLALRNFIFVMGKHEIHGPAVQVERLSEIAHCHCRTLQVPARPAFAERRPPSRLPRIFGRFP